MASPSFNKSQHIKYWKTCLNSLLPTDYTSTDSMRVALGFFILSSLDLLGADADILSAAKLRSIHDWILKCQHPNGGFCGSPTHRYPDNFYDEKNSDNADPANLPATFFALLNLNYVGKVSEINRVKCLRWLKTLQRKDGSFGEIIKDGRIEGGRDMRYCHFASAVRLILRGDLPSVGGEDYEDIDVDALVRHIRGGEVWILTQNDGIILTWCRHMMVASAKVQHMRRMVKSYFEFREAKTDFYSWLYILRHCFSFLIGPATKFVIRVFDGPCRS